MINEGRRHRFRARDCLPIYGFFEVPRALGLANLLSTDWKHSRESDKAEW
jgi:hypothetical protein